MSLADFQQAIQDLIRDKDGVLSLDARNVALNTAVLRYSEDAPRPLLVDAVAIAGSLQPMPAGWEPDISVLIGVEYPVDQVPQSKLEMGQVRVRATPTGDRLQLPLDVAAGEILRIGYTTQHTVDGSTDTVPAKHRHAVACLAGSILCGQLAAYYATEGAPLIGADISDHVGKTERFRARKRDLEAEYIRTLGVPEKPVTAAAGAVAHMESTDSQGNGRLFHGRRYPRS
jgi:hypothetical protein